MVEEWIPVLANPTMLLRIGISCGLTEEFLTQLAVNTVATGNFLSLWSNSSTMSVRLFA